MPKVLFIWNYSGKDGNIGSYRPSVYAAHKAGLNIDIAMNFNDTSLKKRNEIEAAYGIKLINFDIDRNPYSIKNYKAYKQLVAIMRRGKYDIIHCNTPMGGILGRLAAKKIKNYKVFYMNRGFAFYKGAPLKNWIIYYNIEKAFARLYTDAIATINPVDFEIAKKFHLRNNSQLKFSLPGPGVELSRFTFNHEARKKIRENYGFADSDVVIISVGELSARKNLISIVEAMGLIKSNPSTNQLLRRIHFMMVGTGDTQEILMKRAAELGIEDSLIFAGFHEDVENYYSAADIFALPSLSEGFGRVGIEAMNIGLPIVTSDAQGINLYSINGVTGYKCKADDYQGFADALVELVSDNELRRKIGAHNQEFAKNFSLENSGNRIAEIYKQLLELDDDKKNGCSYKKQLCLAIGIVSITAIIKMMNTVHTKH